jgi:hypothetical protein
VNYVPVRREDTLIRVPIIKHVAGTDLVIISYSESKIYKDLEEGHEKRRNRQKRQLVNVFR